MSKIIIGCNHKLHPFLKIALSFYDFANLQIEKSQLLNLLVQNVVVLYNIDSMYGEYNPITEQVVSDNMCIGYTDNVDYLYEEIAI